MILEVEEIEEKEIITTTEDDELEIDTQPENIEVFKVEDEFNTIKKYNDNANIKTQELNNACDEGITRINATTNDSVIELNRNKEDYLNIMEDEKVLKISQFDEHVTQKITDFDSNALEKTSLYNDNASTKYNEFNANIQSDFNEAKEVSITDFNINAEEKTTDFNNNYSTKLNEFNNVTDYHERIQKLEKLTSIKQIVKSKEVSFNDALQGPINRITINGVLEQNGMPTPDSPIEINKEQAVTNLFDYNNSEVLQAYFQANVTILTANSSNNTVYVKCKKNTCYTVSTINKSVEYLYVGTTTEQPTVGVNISNIKRAYPNRYVSITTGEDAEYLVIRLRNDVNDVEKEILKSVMIEEAKVAHDFVPYGSWLRYSINNQVGYIPFEGTLEALDLEDKINIIYGLDQKHHIILNKIIKKITLNGTEEEWFGNNSNFYYTGLKEVLKGNTSRLCCTHFKYNSIVWADGNQFGCSPDSGSLWFTPANITSLEGFKGWLADNNITIYYQEKNYEVTDLGIIDKLETTENENVIEAGSLNPPIEIEYALNIKKYIDNKFEELSNAIVSIGGEGNV